MSYNSDDDDDDDINARRKIMPTRYKKYMNNN